jgi:hypothetical protein
MVNEPDFVEIKEGFYLVNSPEIRGYPWYLLRKPGEGTFAEVVKDVEVGIYIAPWPFNKRIVVESHSDAELRKRWDEAEITDLIRMAHCEIKVRLTEDAC